MDKLIIAATTEDLPSCRALARWGAELDLPIEFALLAGTEDEIVTDLGTDGVSLVHRFATSDMECSSSVLASALAGIAGPTERIGWIAPASTPWLDALIAVVAHNGGAVIDHARSLERDGSGFVALSELFAGQYLKRTRLPGDAAWGCLFSAPPVPRAETRPTECRVEMRRLPESGIECLEKNAPDAPAGTPLPKASIVVAIGDGVGRKGAAEARKIVAIAQELGISLALGGTRVVVDGGVLPRACQIGVSGIAVAPKLLISVGASGAPQHWAGIRDAQTILAVNPDAQAPILACADIPVQGDGVAFLASLRSRLWDVLEPSQREILESKPATSSATAPVIAIQSESEESFTDQPLRIDLRSLEFDGFEVFRTHEIDPSWSREKLSGLLRKAGRYAETRLNQGKRNAEHRHCRMLKGEEHREHAVITPPGLKEAFREYFRGGFGKLALPRRHGGLETPHGFIDMVSEIVNGGSVAMGTAFELTMGASLILRSFGSDWMKETVLPGLHDGRFQGTMCLTEAQAGSDLGAVATTAERIEGTDRFRISGSKVFITAGDHDMAENVMHIVLARIKGVAQKGTGAISLFLVPKFDLDEQGCSGGFNGVTTQGLEHKHGMTTSPTVTLKFENAKGWLIARSVEEEMRQPTGLKSMFFFMNYMRHETGTAARAQSMATCLDTLEYNLAREQGVATRDAAQGRKGPSPIFNHSSQRKVLMDMFARTLAGRAMTFHLTELRDRSHRILHDGLAEVASAREALELSSDQIGNLRRLGTELEGLQSRRSKGLAARKALAKDPEASARNEAHLAEIDARIAAVSEATDAIDSRWLGLDRKAEEVRAASRDEDAFALIFTSLVKAQVTDDNIRTLNEGMNAHGGLGFMDETPLSQRLKDSQVLCIWEGTNDIQALNTVGRQIGPSNKDSRGRAIWDRAMEEIDALVEANRTHPRLGIAVQLLARQVASLKEMRDVLCLATPAAKDECAQVLATSGFAEAEIHLRHQELVQASARQFTTWFAQVVEASQFLRTGRVAADHLDANSPEWDRSFLEGRVELVRHFILSPAGMDKGLLAWRDSFWNLLPPSLERGHLADTPEMILA